MTNFDLATILLTVNAGLLLIVLVGLGLNRVLSGPYLIKVEGGMSPVPTTRKGIMEVTERRNTRKVLIMTPAFGLMFWGLVVFTTSFIVNR